MIRLLGRVLGLRAGAGPQATGTRQFTPRLEVLDGRTLPSAGVVAAVGGQILTGYAVATGQVAVAAGRVTVSAEWPPPPSVGVLGGRADPLGGVNVDSGGANGASLQVDPQHVGEEIPQVLS